VGIGGMSEQNKVEVYRRRARGERAGLGFLDNRVVDLPIPLKSWNPRNPSTCAAMRASCASA